MDRKDQLRNVAFGGTWSEQIAAREELALAIKTLKHAAALSGNHDPRQDSTVLEALHTACRDHPKGWMLADAWNRGASIPEPEPRIRELSRIAALLAEGHKAWLG